MKNSNTKNGLTIAGKYLFYIYLGPSHNLIKISVHPFFVYFSPRIKPLQYAGKLEESYLNSPVNQILKNWIY